VLFALCAQHVVNGLFILDKLLERSPDGGLQVSAEIHDGLKAQQQLDLWFDLSRAYLFDKESECAL